MTEDLEFFHPLAREILKRLAAVPGVLVDLTTVHGRCGTGSGLCDDGGHAGDDGCYVLTRIAAHLGIARRR